MADKPDINRASKEELQRAPGIDEKMAENIVQYRDEHGPFRSAEDLRQVPMIGERRVEQVSSAVKMPDQGGGRGDGGDGGDGGRRGDGGRGR
jgi:competence ComEA-like helix-hairpin-helix protein